MKFNKTHAVNIFFFTIYIFTKEYAYVIILKGTPIVSILAFLFKEGHHSCNRCSINDIINYHLTCKWYICSKDGLHIQNNQLV